MKVAHRRTKEQIEWASFAMGDVDQNSPQKQFSFRPIREKLLQTLFEKAIIMQGILIGVENMLSIQTALNFGKPGK